MSACMHSHHIWLMSWLALRAGLAAVTGLVEELILSTDVIFCTSKHTTHLEEEKESQKHIITCENRNDRYILLLTDSLCKTCLQPAKRLKALLLNRSRSTPNLTDLSHS